MKKGKKVKKMTNAQLFSYPNINLKFDKTLIASSAFPTFKVGKLIWGSLLGKDNKELMIISLLSNPKFITYVEKTRQDFIKNHNNFRKYPKLDESDWE